MKSIELLPRGQFILTLDDEQKVKGRFTMIAIDRFCEIKKIDSYFTLLQHIAIGMTIKDYALFISCALQDYHRSDYANAPWKAEDVMDELDTLEKGLSDPIFKDLIRHGIGRITELKEEAPKEEFTADEQKKSLRNTGISQPVLNDQIPSGMHIERE